MLMIFQGYCRYGAFERECLEDASRRSQQLVRRRRCQYQRQGGILPYCRYISGGQHVTSIRKAIYTHIVHVQTIFQPFAPPTGQELDPRFSISSGISLHKACPSTLQYEKLGIRTL